MQAFTLAETLITLAIIGIVATLTIPSLIKNYQKTQLKIVLKKQYSVISNALNKIMFENGGNFGCYGTVHSECQKFYENLYKELKIAKRCENNALLNGCIPKYKNYRDPSGSCAGFNLSTIETSRTAVVLADGTIILPYKTASYYPIFLIDTNGIKGPNKTGHDLFSFRVLKTKGYYIDDFLLNCILRTSGGIPYESYKYVDKW